MYANRHSVYLSALLAGCTWLASPSHALAKEAEWSGYVGIEARLFNQDPVASVQEKQHFSVSARPEMYLSWNNDNSRLIFAPFARLAAYDDERSHVDIRELVYSYYTGEVEFKAGISKVFWGVTESQHLVDIINQTDLVESLDAEEKLGQPMINLNLIKDWGTTGFFVLPGFRERTFPGNEGRIRSIPRVDTDQAVYLSDDEEKHIDYALRYTKSLDNWEIGLSYFYGTQRDPDFISGTDNLGNPVLVPVYGLMHQSGLDLQYINGDWLWKLEAIQRRKKPEIYNAYTFGFEYTLVGVRDSNLDIGLISEYLYDSRGQQATTLFEHDILLAMRLNFNDVNSSEILMGVIYDHQNNQRLYSLEASTRLSDHWKLNVESRIFSKIDNSTRFNSLRADDHIQVELLYYF